MTEQEAQDLSMLKDEIADIKRRAYDYMVHLIGLTDTQLARYRNGQHQAVVDHLRYSQKEIKRLTDAHLRKYPR